MTGGEQRLVSVIVVDARRTNMGSHATLTPEEARAGLDAVDAIARRFGAETTLMAEGAGLVLTRSVAGRSDDAAVGRGVRARIHQALPDSTISLATGRAQTTGRMPPGVAIDRAVELIIGASCGAPPGVLLTSLPGRLSLATGLKRRRSHRAGY